MSATEPRIPRRVPASVRPSLRGPQPADRARLRPTELLGVALQGLRTRKLRAALSALGIAIGIGAMVAVVGVSSSAQANLLAEIDRLGTNLLTVAPGQDLLGNSTVLPDTAVPMVNGMRGVKSDAAIYQLSDVNVYRTPLVPSVQTGGIGVEAAGANLPLVVGTTMRSGRFLGAVANRYPQAVLGAAAAQDLQITSATGHLMVYIGNQWFTVVGVMAPVALDSSLDSDVFLSLPVAERDFHVTPEPSEIYVRTSQSDVGGVANLLPATVNPQDPSGASVDRPSNLLGARAAAKGQFTTLLLGLGAVALLVGAIGIANIMVISVLERRGEIGLRRALGATRSHITIQFLVESALLAAIGGLAGLALGAGATDIYAAVKDEPFVVPLYALIAAPATGLVDRSCCGPVSRREGRPPFANRGAEDRMSLAVDPVARVGSEERPYSNDVVMAVSERLALIAQPTRLQLLDRLELAGELHEQALVDELSTTQQNVSRHLRLLLLGGLVLRRQDGRVVWYRVADSDVLWAVHWIAAHLRDADGGIAGGVHR